MLLSVCVYTSLAAILFSLGWHVWKREERRKAANGQSLSFWSWEIIASILIFAVVTGARYHTGFDHAMYLHQYVSYQKYGFFTRDFEPLFMWVAQLMAGANIHFFFYFAFWAAIEIGILYYALNGYKHLIPWVALLIVLGPTFVHLMNTMRQGVVECAVPLLLTFKCNKKYLPMLALILILSLIHYVALVLMVLFLLPAKVNCCSKSVARVRIVLMALLALAILLGTYPIWLEAFIGLVKKFSFFTLNRYQEVFSFKSELHFPVGPLSLLSILVAAMVVWFMPELVKKTGFPHLISQCAVVSLIYLLPNFMLSNTNCYFMRPFEIFSICFVLTLAATIFWLLNESKKRAASILIAASTVYIYLVMVKIFLNPQAVDLPYLYNTFIGG